MEEDDDEADEAVGIDVADGVDVAGGRETGAGVCVVESAGPE